ncbi:50S ribosomal protein L19 [Candidatus Dependentiae bacterium]|nr:MAG: 50S ribosomal protein L19 [Candidatus Dependentiae bacterium]
MKAQGYTKETIAQIGVSKVDFPSFREGDTIAVHQRIKEGDKERIQVFQGDVIAMHKQGASSTFTVRKLGAHGIAVERTFPFYSPIIKEIKRIKIGDVRRAKLYYVRDRIGKAARLKEKVMTREQKEKLAAIHEAAKSSGE